MSAAMTREEFAALANVSRETELRLQVYADLLIKWNRAINLIGSATLDDVWRRHFWDSAQLQAYLPAGGGTLLDIGSGAGFPGLVLAIVTGGAFAVHLCESDRRKATFLREAARVTGAEVVVHDQRIEDLAAFPVDILTARALASMMDILALGEHFVAPRTQLLLLKGKQAHNELTQAQKDWNMEAVLHRSRSDDSGVIVQIQKVTRHDRTRIGSTGSVRT
jgi:16S rRNA (guanine527-N7)-methyltransferase